MSTDLHVQIITMPGSYDPTADEVAAAISVIAALMASGDDTEDSDTNRPPHWRGAAKLVAQGLTPGRTPAKPGWNTIERLRRAGRGGSGITGL
ncbi:MAG: hypothetical protein HGA19_09880 [Oscillochloris sp.]|nr:hypothetical protein [Oscillochloris sp.]